MREAEAGSRRSPALILALMLTGVLLPLPRAEAFPIEPRTLWELTQQAGLVVWADVEEVAELPPAKTPEEKQRRDKWSDCDIAHLRIRETWRGNASPGERIQVRFNSHFSCPAPDSYEPGQAVIAFLSHNDGHWRTVALSYGTRYPESEDELTAYRRAVSRVRLAEEQAIVARAAGRESASAEVDAMAARALESVFAKERPPYWARSAFDLLRERYGEKPVPQSKPFQDPLLRAQGATTDDTSLLQQWQHFKQRHHLEPKRLPLPVEPLVPGTGANTPL